MVEYVKDGPLEGPRRDVGPLHGERDAVGRDEDEDDEVEPSLRGQVLAVHPESAQMGKRWNQFSLHVRKNNSGNNYTQWKQFRNSYLSSGLKMYNE